MKRPPVRSRAALLGLAAVLVAACGSAPITPGPGSPSPSPLPSPSPVGRPSAKQAHSFETASLSPDGLDLTLGFIGGAPFVPGDPCTSDYAGWAEADGDVLLAAVVDVTPPLPPMPDGVGCDAMGHGRTVSVRLAEPFRGVVVQGLDGSRHLLRAPAGLAVPHGLPAGWIRRSEGDESYDSVGRWRQTWSTLAELPAAGSPGRLDLYQGFGTASGIAGGEEQRAVKVNGTPGVLYRSPTYGEVVLVWMLDGDGLGLEANEADFTPEALIALAERVTRP